MPSGPTRQSDTGELWGTRPAPATAGSFLPWPGRSGPARAVGGDDPSLAQLGVRPDGLGAEGAVAVQGPVHRDEGPPCVRSGGRRASRRRRRARPATIPSPTRRPARFAPAAAVGVHCSGSPSGLSATAVGRDVALVAVREQGRPAGPSPSDGDPGVRDAHGAWRRCRPRRAGCHRRTRSGGSRSSTTAAIGAARRGCRPGSAVSSGSIDSARAAASSAGTSALRLNGSKLRLREASRSCVLPIPTSAGWRSPDRGADALGDPLCRDLEDARVEDVAAQQRRRRWSRRARSGRWRSGCGWRRSSAAPGPPRCPRCARPPPGRGRRGSRRGRPAPARGARRGVRGPARATDTREWIPSLGTKLFA